MSGDFKALKLIHLTISAVLILFCFVIGEPTIEKLKIQTLNQESLIFLAITIVAFFLSHFIFRFHLKKADPKTSLEEKFYQYRIACLTRWGILEAIMILIVFLRSELIIFGILLILYFVFLSPSEERMRNDFRSVGL